MRKKRLLQSSLAFMVVFFTLFGAGSWGTAYGAEGAAKAVRVGIVKEWKGSVSVTKAGGDKPIQVFKKMSINQGDRLRTGDKSRIVIQLVGGDKEDELTIGADADVSFTELKKDGGVKTRIGVWAGSVFTKVKSIAGIDDRFVLETPTTVMAVRGTQFGVKVYPLNGLTQLYVTAGIVRTEFPIKVSSSSDLSGSQPQKKDTSFGKSKVVTIGHQDVFPAQTAAFTLSGLGTDYKYGYADAGTLLTQWDMAVVKAMIAGAADAEEENKTTMKQWSEGKCEGASLQLRACEVLQSYGMLQGKFSGILRGGSDQLIENIANSGKAEPLEKRVAHNMSSFIAYVVRTAVEYGKLTEQEANLSGLPWKTATLLLTKEESQQQTFIHKHVEEQAGLGELEANDGLKKEGALEQQRKAAELQEQGQVEKNYEASLSSELMKQQFIENFNSVA
ncbi:FecR family protein [Paenibacillus alvei]|uniref:FecR family protein n=1 Tax=Paenibacillus alvei TaxID=44250 RepID=UPI00227FFAFC|nr:FecR family protein [Paenibacillus alvei]MCY9735967.1 FecR family protein [Paenibacillus alvei]